MADTEKYNVPANESAVESVDDILAEILNTDGSFREEFTGLIAKYIGEGDASVTVPKVDLSDRSDEDILRSRAVYDSGDMRFSKEKSVDERIEDKIPDEFRDIYSEASSEAQRPEYTSSGSVRYPTMGVGASEQRVVFDADWEEKAKLEAARLERVRQDRMLRGDSTYVRSYVTRASYSGRKNPFIDELSDAPAALSRTNSLYIDPISRDADFEVQPDNSQFYNDNKKSFFQEGFSVIQKSNVAASGKTGKNSGGKRSAVTENDALYTGASRNSSSVSTSKNDTSWLQVDDRSAKKKKKGSHKTKNSTSPSGKRVGTVGERITVENKGTPREDNMAAEEKQKNRVYLYDGKDVESVADETKGLRSTVAEIVDKYNKRTEADEQKKKEELARLEEEKRLEKLRLEERRAHIEELKKDMSPELACAVDTAEKEDGSFDEYEDFSTEPREKKSVSYSTGKSLPVVKKAADNSSDNYLERLGDDTDALPENDTVKKFEREKDGNKKQKIQPKKNNRRKGRK